MNGITSKLQDILKETAATLEPQCQCQVRTTYITDAEVSCPPERSTDVIFRARLNSAPYVSDLELITYLQHWVSSGTATVLVETSRLDVDPMCPTLIQSFNDPLCSAVTEPTEVPTTVEILQPDSTPLIGIVGPIIGALFAGVLLIVIIIIGIQIFKCFSRSKHYPIRSDTVAVNYSGCALCMCI